MELPDEDWDDESGLNFKCPACQEPHRSTPFVINIAAPGVTVAASGATAGAGVATEVAIGTEIVEVAVAAEGIGTAGIVAGGALVVAAGIGGAVVGTIINEAVLSNDTKDIIGDTLLGIWESVGRLPGYLSGSRTPRSTNVASVDPNDKIGSTESGRWTRSMAGRALMCSTAAREAPCSATRLTDRSR